MNKTQVTADQLITQIIQEAENVKALNITLMDLREIENTVCDYFILCTGTSNTHVSAIAASVEKEVSKKLKEKPWHIEGERVAEWILLDYIHVVFHVFQEPVRRHYDIESLWGDAVITHIS